MILQYTILSRLQILRTRGMMQLNARMTTLFTLIKILSFQILAPTTEKELDLDKMKQAASLLIKYNDYKCFCKSPANFRTTVCNITSSMIFADASGDRIKFQISANRFLTGMIRIIVSKLLDVGRGDMSIDEFEGYLIMGRPQNL